MSTSIMPLPRSSRSVEPSSLSPRYRGWDSKSLLHIIDQGTHRLDPLGNISLLEEVIAAHSYAPETVIPRIPHKFGRYQLTGHLADGGQAKIYRAWDPHLLRDVAIKVSKSVIENEMLSVSRITQEGSLLAGIKHRGLVQVFDAGIDEGYAYFVMEYVAGQTLRERFKQTRPSKFRCRQIMLQISAALAVAHDAGILHLDLKPENVIITDGGECRLIDFGMSWLLKKKEGPPIRLVAGTDNYMSPEQKIGQTESWSTRTDIFGLGAILHYLLYGTSPDLVSPQPPRCLRTSLFSASLPAVCRRALSPAPEERYRDATEFHNFLQNRARLILPRKKGNIQAPAAD